MTEPEIYAALLPLLEEVLGASPESVTMESEFVRDLGAESIDLLDLSFHIEARFGIAIEPNELEREAKARLGETPYEEEGVLTAAALAELRAALPGVDPARLAPGLRKSDRPALLTVGFFVHLVEQKLAGREANHE